MKVSILGGGGLVGAIDCGLVAIATDRSLVWVDRGLLASCVVGGLVFLPRLVREAIRVTRWERAGVGWPRRRRATLLALAILLAMIGLGTLFLALDLSSHHLGSAWVLIGLMGFLRPIQKLWDQTPTPPLKRGPAWITETQLEICSGCLMILMGVFNCLFTPK